MRIGCSDFPEPGGRQQEPGQELERSLLTNYDMKRLHKLVASSRGIGAVLADLS